MSQGSEMEEICDPLRVGPGKSEATARVPLQSWGETRVLDLEEQKERCRAAVAEVASLLELEQGVRDAIVIHWREGRPQHAICCRARKGTADLDLE